MNHLHVPSLLVVFLLAAPCVAQEWADKMFTTREHDFGTVARAAKTEFAFEFTNLYLEDVHIASVRASCGCTTPRIEKETLKTYEKGAIIAHINSDSFLGRQGATLTVTIDKPLYAEVQLQVKVYVYSDVLLEPSSVALGNVALGISVERTIRVQHDGSDDWQIVEVKTNNPHLTVKATAVSRKGDQVAYEVKAVLAKTAPPGYVNEYVWLVTNDPQVKQIPVLVEGNVQAEIAVHPSPIFFGTLQKGQSATKQIVVHGKKPFRITSVQGDCKCLKATVPKGEEAKSLYIIPVTFTAQNKPGIITQTVHIETDLGKTILEVSTYAVVGGS
jgi:hypothetical protein